MEVLWLNHQNNLFYEVFLSSKFGVNINYLGSQEIGKEHCVLILVLNTCTYISVL